MAPFFYWVNEYPDFYQFKDDFVMLIYCEILTILCYVRLNFLEDRDFSVKV